MVLQIRLIKKPEKASATKKVQVFNEQGGTLGRGDKNTWVLPDPDRFLSSCHCQISFDTNHYYLIDLSTNGTFLNGSPEPLGKGVRTRLESNDQFEIGDYCFTATIVEGVPASDEVLFSVIDPSSGLTDSSFGLSGSFAEPVSEAGFSPLPLTTTHGPNLDPLVALDKSRELATEKSYGAYVLADGDECSSAHHDVFTSSTFDDSEGLNQSIEWPVSRQENLIPADWEAEFPNDLGALVLSVPTAGQAVARKKEPVDFNKGDATIRPTPGISLEPITNFNPAGHDADTGVKNNKNKAHSGSAASSVAHGGAHKLISAMRLNAEALTDEQLDEICGLAGQLIREAVDGMMQVMRSRTSIKNEFRMSVTAIKPVGNNPLKFSVGVDEALENIFIKKNKSYKEPMDSFREGFREVGEHQIAMVAGIRYGFEKMVERFNPDMLIKNFNKLGKVGVVPGIQKARYWSAYNEYYQHSIDNIETSFQQLFGNDFVEGYEDQLQNMCSLKEK